MKKVIVSFLLAATSVFPAASQTYNELCEQAIAATEQDSLQQAEDLIRQALKLEPKNPHNALLFSNLGTIQRSQGRLEQALESYTFALNFTPRSVPVLLNRATLYMEMGKEDHARVDYSLVIDLDKDNQEALRMRAYIYMKMRDYKLARADYLSLLKLNPTDFNGRLGLATLEQKEGKYPEALALLNGLLTDKDYTQLETQAVLYVARAGVEIDAGQPDLALIDLEEAIKLDASQAEAYLMRGQLYLSQQKKKLAKEDLEKAVSLGVAPGDVRDLLQQCK